MRALTTFFAAAALVLGVIGSARASIELPPGYDAEDDGVWLLGSLPGNSWSQRISVNKWGVYQTHYQFRLLTAEGDPYGPQQFDPSGLQIYHHGLGLDTSWVPFSASYDGVDDALMWASGSPGSHGVADYVWVKFTQGEIDNYPNPYNSTWTNTPEFVLQLQMYGYHYADSTKTIKRWSNDEFYFDGTNWHYGTSQSQPSPSYLSGQSPGDCPEWEQNSPIPEPASLVVWGALGVLGVAGTWRRRRKAA